MSQISRPFQIALLAMGLFVAVWFVALRGHTPAPSGQGSSAPAPATASAAASAPASASSGGGQAEKSAAPTSVYGGSAPGVAGLSRAIAKAHGAVAESQQNAKQLAEKSAQASSSASVVKGSAEATATSKKSASTPSSSATAAPKVSVTAVRAAPPAAKPIAGANRLPARQVLVEQALKQGAVAVVLFWSPKGSDDVAVHRELQLLKAVHERIRAVANIPEVGRLLKAVGLELNRKIAVQEAPPSQVASFGSITRSVQVSGTPTILIINKRGHTTTLVGLTDAYAIEQAIDEARRA